MPRRLARNTPGSPAPVDPVFEHPSPTFFVSRCCPALPSPRVLSCTIIVSGANKWTHTYHVRMPVILDEEDFDGWLDGSLGADAPKCASESVLREWLARISHIEGVDRLRPADKCLTCV